MFNFINRGIEKIKSLFSSRQEDKCKNCSVIKNGGISPAIVFTQQNINHDDCNENCALDNKVIFIVARILILFLIGFVIYRYGAIAFDVVSYYFK